MSQLAKQDAQQVAPRLENLPVDAPLSEVLRLALIDERITPEKLERLLIIQERVEDRMAEREFTAAFARLKFPPIRKSTKGHTSKYAAFEDIQEIIDPILAAEGFTLTYSSGAANAKGEIPTYGLLSHILGFSRKGEIWLPPDGVATRSGGMNMNALQAIGSSTSYGQRYVAKMMLNLRFIGDDDDAGSASALTAAQRANIEDFFQDPAQVEGAIGPQHLEAFLKFMGVKSISDIQRSSYTPAIGYLNAKRKQQQAPK